jgi:hypothetical protein
MCQIILAQIIAPRMKHVAPGITSGTTRFILAHAHAPGTVCSSRRMKMR